MIKKLIHNCLCNKTTVLSEQQIMVGISNEQVSHFLLFSTVIHLISICFQCKKQIFDSLIKKSVRCIFIMPMTFNIFENFHFNLTPPTKWAETVLKWDYLSVEALLSKQITPPHMVAKRHADAKELWKKAVTKATGWGRGRGSVTWQHRNLENLQHSQWEPELCIQLLKIPAAQNYSAIRRVLDRAPKKWVLEFLERDGFGVLLNSLLSIGNKTKGCYSLADTYSQLQCVLCLRAVMNSPAGLQYIVKRRLCIRKLGGKNKPPALPPLKKSKILSLENCDTSLLPSKKEVMNNVPVAELDNLVQFFSQVLQTQDKVVKLQVFELLCTLSMYSVEGHALVLDALNYFKTCHGRKYRLDLVVSELESADTFAYKTTLVAFINCLLFGYPDITQRSLLRCEFHSAGLKRVLEELSKSQDEGLQLQLAVFEEQRQKDENEVEPVLLEKVKEILLKKIGDTPESLALQLVLLKISQLDPSHPESEQIRDILENISTRSASQISSIEPSNALTSGGGSKPEERAPQRRHTREIAVQTTTTRAASSRYSPSVAAPRRSTSSTQVELRAKTSSNVIRPDHTRRQPTSNTSIDRLKTNNTIKTTSTPNNKKMGACLNRLPSKKDSLSSIAEQTNALGIRRIFVESSSQTTVDSLPVGVQVNFRCSRTVADCSTQTTVDTTTICRCSTLRTDWMINETNINVLASKVDDSKQMRNNGALNRPSTAPSSGTIPPPPPIPPPLPPSSTPMRKNLRQNNAAILNSNCSTPTNVPPPPPPPLPSTIKSFINSERYNDSTPKRRLNLNDSILNVLCTPPPSPPPLPAMFGHSTLPSRKPSSTGCVDFLLKKYNTLPKSNIKMRTLNWAKIPQQTIEKSVWSSVESEIPGLSVDFKKMEELFCQAPTKKSVVKKTQTPLMSKRSTTSLNILDDKRSFAVNIFLKQFKPNVGFIIDSIRNGSGLSAENLRALKRLLPEKQELAEISAHSNDVNLAEAEQFFLRLSEIPDYELTISAMLHKEEFHERFSDVSSQLDNVLGTCDFLINDSSLKQFLALVLQLGNYLNAGSYAGNAVGFKLSTLPKLTETRANKPRMTFLHYAVDVANTNNSSLLDFRKKASELRGMAKTPTTCIEEEVHTLAVAINEIHKKLKSSELSSRFGDFFKNAKNKVDGLVKRVNCMKEIAIKLAEHFCEDPSTFQLHECFMLFAEFFEKVNAVFIENEHMKKVEERVARIASEREKSDRRQAGRKAKLPDEINMVDMLMQDIKGGIFKLRRSQGAEQP